MERLPLDSIKVFEDDLGNICIVQHAHNCTITSRFSYPDAKKIASKMRVILKDKELRYKILTSAKRKPKHKGS